MKSSFHSNLINSPFDDPCLYIRILRENRAILFDLGSNYSLEPSKLLKVSDIFVSHTHIDHFIGFDNILRLFLGREKMLRVFGPPGIISNVEGKLRAYTWNLVGDYPFVLEVKEVSGDRIKSARFVCRDKFRREDITVDSPFKCVLMNEQLFKISAVHLDHLIPSMAFSFSEDFHINIKKDALLKYGLHVGQWLGELKKHIREGKPDDFKIEAPSGDGKKIFRLNDLKNDIVLISKGQKIAYVSDVIYSNENIEKIISLAEGADIFYCEATFLEEDIERAREKYHLTARQAGELARRAGVKRLEIFHFSPRYKYREELLYREAMAEFGKV
ncbi:MAG: ribonuclease Z [Nitrospinae bacterium]|nr:ribonuclease Z [Nitrospinota bacterium]MBI3813710.1 ribonuclease Z [Nitrospinota bacterium]